MYRVTNFPVAKAVEIPVATIVEGVVTTTAEDIMGTENGIKWRTGPGDDG